MRALTVLSIPVLREGNVLELPNQRLSVVEACSGIRSLLSLTFLSLVYGYFFERKTWVRVVLFLFHDSDRHHCQRQPGDDDRHHDPGEGRTGRRVLSRGRGLGDLHGGAGDPDSSGTRC